MSDHSLLIGLEELAGAPEARLRSPEWLTGVLRRVGLVRQPHAFDEADHVYLCPSPLMGIFQQPEELASVLISLADENVQTFLEVGTWTGWTIALITAYLKRFSPGIHVTALDIDLLPSKPMHAMASGLPLTFVQGETKDLDGKPFDVVLIDGDHRYDWCKLDYECVGKHARICAICDVNDERVSGLSCGGAARLWQELLPTAARAERHFLRPGRIGIGVLYQDVAALPGTCPEDKSLPGTYPEDEEE